MQRYWHGVTSGADTTGNGAMQKLVKRHLPHLGQNLHLTRRQPLKHHDLKLFLQKLHGFIEKLMQEETRRPSGRTCPAASRPPAALELPQRGMIRFPRPRKIQRHSLRGVGLG